MTKLYLDSETCGLHSMPVLLQWAVESGPITLYDLWLEPVGRTLDLIEWFCEHIVVGFNLSFDWFQIVKVGTIWRLLDRDWIPIEHVDEIAAAEREAQEGPCIKPAGALDLMLHSRKGPYQSLMARDDIRIRRVPTVLAASLAAELERRVQFDGIYFAKSSDPDAPRWKVFDRRDREGQIDPDFKDVVLKFHPAGGLKFLAEHALKLKPKFHYKDVEPDPSWRPIELGYAPFAAAVSSQEEDWAVYEYSPRTANPNTRLGAAILETALEYELDPSLLIEAVDYVHGRDLQAGREYERALLAARKMSGLTPAKINRWEDSGRDYSLWPGLDETAREVAGEYPELGIGRGYQQGENFDDTDYARLLWDLLREPIKPVRSKLKCLDEAASLLRQNPTGAERRVLRGYAWPGVIRRFVEHWAENKNAREYASDDIVYTRLLDAHFGNPEPNDDDSILACMVPVVRWRGFCIDEPGIEGLLENARAIVEQSPVNVNSPSEIRRYLGEVMDETEQLLISDSTAKDRVEQIAEWLNDDKSGPHQAAGRAKEILLVKEAAKEIELYQKLLKAGKLHAGFNVIGTKSNRMSGDGGLNAQGIKAVAEVRAMFPFAWPGYQLSGGDFSSFEVTLADAVYGDPKMREIVLSGKNILAIFGTKVYPDKTAEEIYAKKKTRDDLYTSAKQGFYAQLYFGEPITVAKRCGVSVEEAERALRDWRREMKGIAAGQRRIIEAFTALKQPSGIGTAVIWNEPADYVESFLGFRRYFTLENKILRALFDLARKPPKEWRNVKLPVIRDIKRGRVQTAGGAVASALYGAAFGLSSANVRAAGNHEIQSPGGQITKQVERAIWDACQPAGISELRIAPMNIHDEIMVVVRPDMVDAVADVVTKSVESFRDKVPLIGMDWYKKFRSWAGKEEGIAEGEIKIRSPLAIAA